jgi:hypothetical protein
MPRGAFGRGKSLMWYHLIAIHAQVLNMAATESPGLLNIGAA